MKHLLEHAKRIIAIDSVTQNGNEEISQYMVELMQDAGLKTQLQQVSHSLDGFSKRQFNVIGILGDTLVDRKTKKGLLLNTHLDTVGPGLKENWTETGGNPFVATIHDGKIFGLGSADVKLDFLCKLRAVEKFRERKLKMPIYLVGTCGEESGMFGAKYLIKSLALNPKFVMVGEPSDLSLVVAHKCLAIYRLRIDYQMMERDARGFNRRVELSVRGRSAHSSYPHLGINAILRALEFVEMAQNNGFELRFTKLEGGESKNKVPDQAKIEFYLTSHQYEDFKRYFREWTRAKKCEKDFSVELGGLGESGVKFLPDALYPCLTQSIGEFFKYAGSELALKNPIYDPPSSTLNMGMMIQRPTGVDVYFDLRLLPEIDFAKVDQELQDKIQKVSSQFPQINLSISRERVNPGLAMTEDHELVVACKAAMEDCKIPSKTVTKATSTEAAQYFQAGFPAVVFGPGKSVGNSHSPNEHNILEHLEKAVLFYQRLIERLCT